MYLTARGLTNETYYVGAEARPLPGHQQHRQRRAGLPRAVDDGAEADDRRRRHDGLVHRRHRHRPRRALRQQRRQRPAGVHEVPVPGAQAGREGRGRQPAAGAGPRALLGAEQRRERDVRHEDGRRVLRRAHGRRRRVPQRRAEGAPRRAAASTASSSRAHDRVRRARRRARPPVVRRPRAAVRGVARRHGALRPDVRVGGLGGARLVDGHHPARARRRQRRRHRQPRARARQRRPARRRAHADPRPLRRAGRRRDGRVRDRAPGRRARRRPRRAAALADAVRLPGAAASPA